MRDPDHEGPEPADEPEHEPTHEGPAGPEPQLPLHTEDPLIDLIGERWLRAAREHPAGRSRIIRSPRPI